MIEKKRFDIVEKNHNAIKLNKSKLDNLNFLLDFFILLEVVKIFSLFYWYAHLAGLSEYNQKNIQKKIIYNITGITVDELSTQENLRKSATKVE